jgi:DNA-binding beta-propeller fold protein YncE
MANNIAFQPMGALVVMTASSANVQGNVVTITASSPSNQYYVSNPDKDNGIFVAYGQTANITASIPVEGTPANVVYIPPYTSKVFTGPQCSATKTVYARMIGPHNNAVCYVCPGEGL